MVEPSVAGLGDLTRAHLADEGGHVIVHEAIAYSEGHESASGRVGPVENHLCLVLFADHVEVALKKYGVLLQDKGLLKADAGRHVDRHLCVSRLAWAGLAAVARFPSLHSSARRSDRNPSARRRVAV